MTKTNSRNSFLGVHGRVKLSNFPEGRYTPPLVVIKQSCHVPCLPLYGITQEDILWPQTKLPSYGPVIQTIDDAMVQGKNTIIINIKPHADQCKLNIKYYMMM